MYAHKMETGVLDRLTAHSHEILAFFSANISVTTITYRNTFCGVHINAVLDFSLCYKRFQTKLLHLQRFARTPDYV
jgi:hypothetical protein